MKIIDSFEPESNFWKLFPSLAIMTPFKQLYASDKSPNKASSSKLMWCVAFIWDSNSKFYNLPEEGDDSKITMIFTDYYGDLSYYKKYEKKIDTLREAYLKLQETPAARSLREIEAKIEERSRFLKNTPYDLGVVNEKGQWVGNTVVIIDKMLADTKKVYDLYDQAMKTVEKEKASGDDIVKGGGTLSLNDSENDF